MNYGEIGLLKPLIKTIHNFIFEHFFIVLRQIVAIIFLCRNSRVEKGLVMDKLSVYIVTLNEEERLGLTIQAALQVADEIIIVDSGSTDKTLEIARKLGANTVYHAWKNISAQKNFAQDLCNNDWVLSLDADEVLSEELIKEINELKENHVADAYKIRILDMCPGDVKPRCFAKRYNQVRLYNRTKANMPDDLTHDRVIVYEKAKIVQLKGQIYHFSYQSLRQLWVKYNLYTDEMLVTSLAKGKNYFKFRLLYEFPYQFVRYYFWKRFFMYGTWGFIMSMSLAYFRFLKIAKFIEYKMLNHKK